MAQESKPQTKPHGEEDLEEKAHADSGDIESGGGSTNPLYPKMTEDPKLRWAFIRKVYTILSAQFAFTAAVAAVGAFVKPIPVFLLSHTPAAWAVYIVVLLLPLLVMWPMLVYREKHPLNIILLALFTVCISLSVGISSALVGGRAVLQAAILTAVVVVGLTLYTFGAVRRGQDFTFLFPFLFCCLLVLVVYCLMQIFFPLGKLAHTIYGCMGTLVFSGFIIYDTERLIKRHTYNEYVFAAISLYLDVINLFMSSLAFSSSCQ
ncbi:Bax inhibitor-1 family protein [Rhynchospora pubera]|uniref:Bax inhibitor-1 family protein n=1 Tax=Rhynchospora pubera TaxID=906938 RepID=A0AAV8CP14_9POAL|nr:Bax inhibitor-1 family protein [Rhynchospora pubera]KAJ4762482.1 Bax inhibitor-1 family protein [Rhynchospora pubera]